MILYDQSATATTNPRGLIQLAWMKYKGNTNWPVPGATKYMLALSMVNQILIYEYAMDDDVHWDSLYDGTRTYGPVIANVQAYDLDEDVFYLSDWVYIKRLDGNIDRFQVVHPEQRNRSFNAIGQVGSDNGDPVTYLTGSNEGGDGNITLNFQDNFVLGGNMSDDIGGTITAGVYAIPDQLANPGDIVPVNKPGWLVTRLAAELARNDPAKQDQYDPLMSEADNLYQKMVKGNQGNSYQQPNGPMYQQQQVGVTWTQF